MKFVNVRSSMISKIGYDRKRSYLRVVFENGNWSLLIVQRMRK